MNSYKSPPVKIHATHKLAGLLTLVFLFHIAGIAVSRATIIFQEDFEEATLGGTYTPPSTYGTGISPAVGTNWGVFLNDHGEIVTGTPIGSGQALAGYDLVEGLALRIVAGADTSVSGPVSSGKLEVSFDFVVDGTLADSGGPFQLLLQTSTATTFIQMLVYSNLDETGTPSIVFNNSTSGTAPDSSTATSIAKGSAVHIFMDVDIDHAKYDVKVTRLSDSAVLNSLSSLDFRNDTDLGTEGFKYLDMQFGFADFSNPNGSGTASALIDNMLVQAIPEPQTVLLLGMAMTGMFFAYLRRHVFLK